VRTGHVEVAQEAWDRLADTTVPDSDWAAGAEARARAMLRTGAAAEDCYREAVSRLSSTPLQPELGRAHLLYGEWLRRENRRLDARAQLRTAFELFTAMGAEGFAERTRRELMATGERTRRRDAEASAGLTPQELHIARLARSGRTNIEIGAELYLSARTVEWHLRKVFGKLDITSRRELRDALPGRNP
jgi:DNA-binding CsgD family transcriptional regulator